MLRKEISDLQRILVEINDVEWGLGPAFSPALLLLRYTTSLRSIPQVLLQYLQPLCLQNHINFLGSNVLKSALFAAPSHTISAKHFPVAGAF